MGARSSSIWGAADLYAPSDFDALSSAAEDDIDVDGEADESELAGTGGVAGGSTSTGVQLMSERRRTGRQATDTRHITMAMLEEGGYFDMPLKVLLLLYRAFPHAMFMFSFWQRRAIGRWHASGCEC